MLLEMDLQYVRQQSFWLDLRLIGLTAYLVLFKSWYVLLRRHKRKALPPRSSTV
jgi:lipopolysaccharide/colanic/teichoic acid biosynthesis glycosyltransferase